MSAFLVKEDLTVQAVASQSTSFLSASGIEQPRLDAEILLAEVLGGRREDIYIHSDRIVSSEERIRYALWIERRAAREPVAYILGYREFWSLDFKVSPAVLIPRPETEGVIERMLALQAKVPSSIKPNILDLCTGSGILAVVAALEIPASRIIAVDISAQALKVAQENARVHHVANRIDFFEGNLFEGWEAPECRELDYILCNPPYIESGLLSQLQVEIHNHEPALALDGGPDGMEFYKRIIPTAVERLRPGGFIILEMDPGQASALAELLAAQPAFENIVVTRDYSGRNRVVSARRASLG